MRWVQYTYCYLFFSLGLPLCEFQERESPTVQHSFKNIAGEAKLVFVYILSRLCDAVNKMSPKNPFLCTLSCFRTLLLGCFGSFLSCFCSPSPPKSSYCDCGKRVQFYCPNTKADLKPKEIVTHGHIALSASLASERRHFISNHGLKTI